MFPENAITDFHGEHYWLDNMFIRPFRWNDLTFNAVEQGFVYFKTTDPDLREQILRCDDPYECKAMGRVRGVMRPDWDEIKFGIMYKLIERKFETYPELIEKLVLTGDRMLIEGNTWDDNIWGDCFCSSCRDIPGQNFLGKFLMSLRTQYQEA